MQPGRMYMSLPYYRLRFNTTGPLSLDTLSATLHSIRRPLHALDDHTILLITSQSSLTWTSVIGEMARVVLHYFPRSWAAVELDFDISCCRPI
jgi:hypothetical protein